MRYFALNDLSVGESAVVRGVSACGALRTRLFELGFCPGAPVRCLHRSPLGDPCAYGICGAVIALRGADAACIAITEDRA